MAPDTAPPSEPAPVTVTAATEETERMADHTVPRARHEHSAPVPNDKIELHLLMDHHAAVPEARWVAYHEAAHGGWPDAVSYDPVNRGR